MSSGGTCFDGFFWSGIGAGQSNSLGHTTKNPVDYFYFSKLPMRFCGCIQQFNVVSHKISLPFGWRCSVVRIHENSLWNPIWSSPYLMESFGGCILSRGTTICWQKSVAKSTTVRKCLTTSSTCPSWSSRLSSTCTRSTPTTWLGVSACGLCGVELVIWALCKLDRWTPELLALWLWTIGTGRQGSGAVLWTNDQCWHEPLALMLLLDQVHFYLGQLVLQADQDGQVHLLLGLKSPRHSWEVLQEKHTAAWGLPWFCKGLRIGTSVFGNLSPKAHWSTLTSQHLTKFNSVHAWDDKGFSQRAWPPTFLWRCQHSDTLCRYLRAIFRCRRLSSHVFGSLFMLTCVHGPQHALGKRNQRWSGRQNAISSKRHCQSRKRVRSWPYGLPNRMLIFWERSSKVLDKLACPVNTSI